MMPRVENKKKSYGKSANGNSPGMEGHSIRDRSKLSDLEKGSVSKDDHWTLGTLVIPPIRSMPPRSDAPGTDTASCLCASY